jgi:heme ABC exporter ATP-binding subunit CcmA
MIDTSERREQIAWLTPGHPPGDAPPIADGVVARRMGGGASPGGCPEDSASPCMDIIGLKKSYGLKPILRGIDLVIEPGERVALLGANGTGKTTLLRILAGLTKPSAGSITIEEFDILRDAQAVRRLVGFVAHQPYLYEELTALENLLFFGRMYSVEHAQERALMLIQRVGLEKRMRERINTFSRGQIQRLAWARALLHTPRVLLLDEPDTGLDQEGQMLIDSLLQEHTERGGTTLFTTHQLERAVNIGTRVVVLNKGRIVYQCATASVTLDELQHVYQQVVTP